MGHAVGLAVMVANVLGTHANRNGAVLPEQRLHLAMAPVPGPIQRCAIEIVFRVDVRPCVQERLGHRMMPVVGSDVECCVRAPIFVIRIRSSLERHENPAC